MSSTITGNPAGIVSPMVTPPTPNVVPVYTVPTDGDAAGAASITPANQQSANHLAYLMQQAVWNATFPTTSTNLPQMRFKDAAGNGRSVVDHNGYIGLGRVSEFRDGWLFAPGASQSSWTATLGTAAAIAAQSPTAAYNARFLQLTPSTTAGPTNYCLASSVPLFVPNVAGLSLVLEFEFGLNAAAAGTTSNVSWFIGMDSGVDPENDLNQITLYKNLSVANYQTNCDQSVLVLTVPTAPTAGVFPTDRIRFEIQGSGSPYAAYQVRFWINEVLVATRTTSLPGAVAMRLTFGCANDGGAPVGSPLGFLGPIQAMWNRFTSGPNL